MFGILTRVISEFDFPFSSVTHTLLQAIARVNRVYDAAKTYGLIVDYCGITRELQKALAIFDYEDIKGALEPVEKEIQELKLRHAGTIAFFDDVDKKDDRAIIEKFEPANTRDEFDYAFKMFYSDHINAGKLK